MTRWVHFFVALALCGVATTARAQERPAVFLHGLNSSPGAWSGAAERLRQKTMIAPNIPQFEWWTPYEQQARWLNVHPGYVALSPTTTVAIGHSNGGIVAREWNKSHRLGGIITIGTPHAGVPLIHRFGQWMTFMGATSGLVNDVSSAFNRSSPMSWVIGEVIDYLGWASAYATVSVVNVAITMGLDYNQSLFQQMLPGSPYLNALNSSGNLQREASAAPRRVGIVSAAYNFYWAGPARAAFPEHGDTFMYALYGTIDVLYAWGNWIASRAEHGDVNALRQANALIALAAHLEAVDPTYCMLVSSTVVNTCVPNDGIVPETSQRYPGAATVYIGYNQQGGPSHTQLTSQSDDVLYDTLVNVMQVPRRTQQPPSGPPPGPVPPPGPQPPPEPQDPDPPAPPGPPSQPAPPIEREDTLSPGESMRSHESVWSQDGRFQFVFQGDGNLVLYHHGTPIWASNTAGMRPGRLNMQHDGNLVMLDEHDQWVWHSGSHGWNRAWLIVQNDGNVVIYTETGQPVWATNTAR